MGAVALWKGLLLFLPLTRCSYVALSWVRCDCGTKKYHQQGAFVSEEKNFLEAGARIRALRGKATQGEFADQMGINRKTVERWESGERLPDGQSLLALMTVFGADVNYILTGKKPGDMVPSLSAEETTLLEYFRAAKPEVRRAAMGALLGAAAPSPRYTVDYGDAKIKQASAGNIVNKGRRK